MLLLLPRAGADVGSREGVACGASPATCVVEAAMMHHVAGSFVGGFSERGFALFLAGGVKDLPGRSDVFARDMRSKMYPSMPSLGSLDSLWSQPASLGMCLPSVVST